MLISQIPIAVYTLISAVKYTNLDWIYNLKDNIFYSVLHYFSKIRYCHLSYKRCIRLFVCWPLFVSLFSEIFLVIFNNKLVSIFTGQPFKWLIYLKKTTVVQLTSCVFQMVFWMLQAMLCFALCNSYSVLFICGLKLKRLSPVAVQISPVSQWPLVRVREYHLNFSPKSFIFIVYLVNMKLN